MRHLASAVSPLLAGSLVACATTGLDPLVLDGPELHPSLTPKSLEAANHGLPTGVRDNPHLTTDAEVVRSIASYASQGRLVGDGVRAALYAVYQAEREVGFYGLEVATTVDADRLEGALREIWAKNVSIDRTRVHRGGRVFVIVWNDGVSPECWRAVNEGLVERLADR